MHTIYSIYIHTSSLLQRQDNSSSVTLRSEGQATTAAVTSFQVQHASNVSNIVDLDGTDVPLALAPTPVSRSAGQRDLVPALTNTEGALTFGGNASASSGRPRPGSSRPSRPTASGPTSLIPAVDKCLKGCKDPVIAGPKIRKLTMKDFSILESKISKTFMAIRETLNLIQDDFDDEAGWLINNQIRS